MFMYTILHMVSKHAKWTSKDPSAVWNCVSGGVAGMLVFQHQVGLHVVSACITFAPLTPLTTQHWTWLRTCGRCWMQPKFSRV